MMSDDERDAEEDSTGAARGRAGASAIEHGGRAFVVAASTTRQCTTRTLFGMRLWTTILPSLPPSSMTGCAGKPRISTTRSSFAILAIEAETSTRFCAARHRSEAADDDAAVAPPPLLARRG